MERNNLVMVATKAGRPALTGSAKLTVTETEKTFRLDSIRVIKKSAIQSTLFRTFGLPKNPETTMIGGNYGFGHARGVVAVSFRKSRLRRPLTQAVLTRAIKESRLN